MNRNKRWLFDSVFIKVYDQPVPPIFRYAWNRK